MIMCHKGPIVWNCLHGSQRSTMGHQNSWPQTLMVFGMPFDVAVAFGKALFLDKLPENWIHVLNPYSCVL